MAFNLLFSEPALFFAWILAILFGISIHEFAHAFAADRAGDPTAKNMGRLTLNPLAHLDPLGTIMLLFVGFGWGRPVPVNPYNFREHKWSPLLVSLAGPISNLLGVIFFGVFLKLLIAFTALGAANLLIQFLDLLIVVNLVLMLFNLLPIPPLDGAGFLVYLPQKLFKLREFLEMRGPMILLILVIIDSFSSVSIFGALFGWIINLVFRLF